MRQGRLLLQLGGTLLAFGLVLWWLGPAQIVQRLYQADPGWLATAVGALVAQTALSAWRWRVTAAALAVCLPRGVALREYFMASFGNTVLPGGVLGDAARILRLAPRSGLGLAAQSVVLERMAGQVALAIATAMGVVIWLRPASGVVMLTLAGFTALCLALWAAMPALRRVLLFVWRIWTAQGAWRAQTALSGAILGCNLLGFWTAAGAVGVSLPLQAAVPVLCLTLMVMLIPVSVNGWGLREGTAAVLWPMAGVAAVDAVAASVMFGLAILIAALPGALFVWPLNGRTQAGG